MAQAVRVTGGDRAQAAIDPRRLAVLGALERKVLWLACWMIHNANHLRPSRDGLKVGGHQASCASITTLMTALYFGVLRPNDRVAVKPHASPVLHAIQYLLGKESRARLERFRALGGAQAYPSRTKDEGGVDFSTGSVGLGVAMTLFASLTQDLIRLQDPDADHGPEGRMIALVGDAELDEGNVWEALLEGWKHDVRNLWWVIDYNRQSLDRVVPERLWSKIEDFFTAVGWNVVTIKYGKRLQAAFERPSGPELRRWIDACPNDLYSALVFKGGAAWREHLELDLGHVRGIRELLKEHDDEGLARLMTNLGGHDLEAVLEAFAAADGDDRPHCFLAYTIKGFGLPFAGHKDNHAGLMNQDQMAQLRRAHAVPEGEEWERFAGLDFRVEELRAFLADVPFAKRQEVRPSPPVPVPTSLPTGRSSERASTQEAFGRTMGELARGDGELSGRIITASPDVTVSTSLGAWVNRRGVFSRHEVADVFRLENVVSAQKWALSRRGQHIELGIAEHNLFLTLAALGLAGPLFGRRLLPVGTVYDPFIARGLDALIYALYQDARFMLVATPSGITLAPEGGAHQSLTTPLIGMGLPGLTAFEPAFADELAEIMRFGFERMQAEEGGGSVYLRLSTRTIAQPKRELTPALKEELIRGAYWLVEPSPDAELALVYTGAAAPEVLEAQAALADDPGGVGVLAVTSAERLHADWRRAQRARAEARAGEGALSHIERLLACTRPDCALITVQDGHPAALSWLGAAARRPVYPLGVAEFGQSGDIPDLYRRYRIDAEAIIDMAALACREAIRSGR